MFDPSLEATDVAERSTQMQSTMYRSLNGSDPSGKNFNTLPKP